MSRFLSLIFLFFTAVLAAGPVSFERRVLPGSSFDAELSLNTSREYRFMLSGREHPVQRRETFSLVFLGTIRVLKVNLAGNPLEMELRPAFSSGSMNGRTVPLDILSGHVIHADLNRFPCRFTDAATGKPVSEPVRLYLSSFFRKQPESGLADILGAPRELRIGMRWVPAAEPLLEIMKKRGIMLKKENISVSAECSGSTVFHRIPCWQIRFKLETRARIEPDLRLTADFLLAKDPRNGGILKMQRNGTEIVSSRLSDREPLSSGSSICVISKETFHAVLLPKKNVFPSSEPLNMILK